MSGFGYLLILTGRCSKVSWHDCLASSIPALSAMLSAEAISAKKIYRNDQDPPMLRNGVTESARYLGCDLSTLSLALKRVEGELATDRIRRRRMERLLGAASPGPTVQIPNNQSLTPFLGYDGFLVGQFDVVAGAGISNFTTFPGGSGIGATRYDFVVSAGPGVDASYIAGILGPINDMHFTSSQVLPVGTSLTSSFHNNAPSNAGDIYPTTAVGIDDILLKVDGSNVFTTPIPEPETYAMMLAGLGLMGFVMRRRMRTRT